MHPMSPDDLMNQLRSMGLGQQGAWGGTSGAAPYQSPTATSANTAAGEQTGGEVQSADAMTKLKALAQQGVPADRAYQLVFGSPMPPDGKFTALYSQLNPANPGSPSAGQAAATTGPAAPVPGAAGTTQPSDAMGPGMPAGDAARTSNATAASAAANGQNPDGTDSGMRPNEMEFGWKPGDNVDSWAQHAFGQGMASSGNSLYESQNQASLNPYQQWLKNRFGNQAPLTSLMHTLATGPADVKDVAGNTQNDMNTFGKNAFGGSGTPMGGGGLADLQTLADMDARVTGGDTSNIDPGTLNTLRSMNSDPTNDQAMKFALAAYTQKYGEMGAGAYAQRLQNLSQEFGNSGNHPAGSPMFLNYLMQHQGGN